MNGEGVRVDRRHRCGAAIALRDLGPVSLHGREAPLEVYELTQRITVLKIGALLVNVAAIVWLLYSKRLFGLRGGGAAYHAEHAEESLLTVERAAVEEGTA